MCRYTRKILHLVEYSEETNFRKLPKSDGALVFCLKSPGHTRTGPEAVVVVDVELGEEGKVF